MTSTIPNQRTVVYPESDGNPMADNTKQFRWIVTIKENLELLFADQADVFVAGDLLWYPVEGDNKIRQAPDTLVVFGRSKGDRGSYRQWEEGNIPPQVVFEILSPGNRLAEMIRKFKFYEQYGVQEYYVYNPDSFELTGWVQHEGDLSAIDEMNGWISPQLQIRFVIEEGTELEIYRPDGRKFLTTLELEERAQEAETKAQEAETKAQEAETKAQAAEQLLTRYRDRFGDLE
ncbi:MAG: Uma2 family endonuclease [Cyanobacteria bacterium P01_A01_bin.37]